MKGLPMMVDPFFILVALLLIGGIIFAAIRSKKSAGSREMSAPARAVPLNDGRTNGLALASLIVVFFSSVIGLILGHVALSQIDRTGEGGRGLALSAVIIGWVFTGAAVLIGIALATSYGGLLSALR